MNILAGGRATGKTTMLIFHSSQSGSPILVKNNVSADQIKEQARRLGVTIPEPVIWDKGKQHIKRPVLIDNADHFLQSIVQDRLGTGIDMATMRCAIRRLGEDNSYALEAPRIFLPPVNRVLVEGEWRGDEDDEATG